MKIEEKNGLHFCDMNLFYRPKTYDTGLRNT